MNDLARVLPPFGPRLTISRPRRAVEDVTIDFSAWAVEQNRLARSGLLHKGFDLVESFLPARPPMFETVTDGGTTTTLQQYRSLLGSTCPPAPSAWGIAVARIPPAPKLPPVVNDRDDYEILTRAVREQHRSVTGKQIDFGAGWTVVLAETIRAAAEFLRRNGIAPAAWAAFAWAAYQYGKTSRARPRPTWVFGDWMYKPRSLSWFWDWRNDNFGGAGTLLMGPQHREAVERYGLFEIDLVLSRPESTTEAITVLEQHWPGRSFADMLEIVKVEAEQIRCNLKQRVEAGVVLWR